VSRVDILGGTVPARRFLTLDVFTDRPFAGNPLAVVLDSNGLETTAMQAIAREFNLSETVFVSPPGQPSARARLRIFTPARELPFAGHPTVGTAVALGRIDGSGERDFVLEETIGPIACRVRSTGPDSGWASFDILRLPEKEADGPALAAMAESLGLSPADIGLERTERWTAGNPFTFVPLRGIDAMRRCTVDLSRFDRVFDGGGGAAAFLFCQETSDAGNAFHARMFAPGFGVLEDPATGSAVAAFAGYLAAHGGYPDGEHVVRIEQGYEMGRPSLIELTIRIAGGKLAAASIAGDAVVVMEGTI
jgi:trans-2,3-dihydro-3-hydroxyanthranilate isomerase